MTAATTVLSVMVKDEQNRPLGGVDARLTWSTQRDGVKSQTVRSKGKVSMEDQGGLIYFSNMGPGIHRLQLSKPGNILKPVSMEIDVQNRKQVVEVAMEVKPDS